MFLTIEKHTPKQHYKLLKQQLLDLMPFIKRKRYRRLQRELKALQSAREAEQQSLAPTMLSMRRQFATETPINFIVPLAESFSGELCLFVTFAPESTIKSHVIDHALALIDQGIEVVLIVNTTLEANSFIIPASLKTQLKGLIIRDNRGFDFAAWAQTHNLTRSRHQGNRLYLVNDSLVGPLNYTSFQNMVNAIRCCEADMIGLTENTLPRPHLQSFFMAFNRPLLGSEIFELFMNSVLNLPTKELVIDFYETQLTQAFIASGYRCKPVFAKLASGNACTNDTIQRWDILIRNGFPFVKSSILCGAPDPKKIVELVPEKYRVNKT